MEGVVPTFVVVNDPVPSLTILPTQAVLTNQGKTFNEAGHSFNQAGDVFEGITGRDEDIVPHGFVVQG